MTNLQMYVSKIAEVPKHFSQTRVMIETKKLIEKSRGAEKEKSKIVY